MNTGVILRLARRYTSRQLLQSVLFVLGVALGVAVVIAIDLANNSANRAFLLSTESIQGSATHQITGTGNGLPTDLYRDIHVGLGIEESAPVIEGFASVIELGEQPVRLLGVDVFAEEPFRNYLADAQIIGEFENVFGALNAFLAEPDTVLMSETLAQRFNIEVGQTITLRPGAEQVEARVVGFLLPSDSVSAQALEDLLLLDISTAQAIVGEPGRISRIDLILPDDYDFAQITDILPAGAQLTSVSAENTTIEQMTAAFELNLQALSLLALVVGAFLIYNTVTFNVVQRRPVIGTLRSLGMTRDQIFVFILSEALLLAVIGTVLGLALGVILGRGAVQIVSQAVNNLYLTVNVNRVALDPFTFVKGAAIGIVISTVAALIPSWDATRTPPAGVLRRSSIEDQARKQLPLITAVAVILNIVGLIILAIPGDSITLSFVALFAIVVGSALFTPALLVVVMRYATPLTERVFGVLGRMAPRAVARSLSRTSVAVAALTVAVSVIVGVSVMIASFRTTVADWLEVTLSADIYVSPPNITSGNTGMDAGIQETVATVTGVTQVLAARNSETQAPDYPDMPPVRITAIELDPTQDTRRFDWNTAPAGDTVAAMESGMVMVSEPFAFRRGITQRNNTINLLTDNGVQEFEVFAVFFDYTTDQGLVYMDLGVYRDNWDDDQISSLGVYVAEDVALTDMIDTLETQTLVGLDVIVQSNRTLREGVFEVFNQAFSITVALRLLATIVAFIGILSALLALQLENTRQYGLMRAVGLTPGQLRRFTIIQTGLMGFTSGLLALPIGLALAAVLIFVINIRSFGWSMYFMPQTSEMAQAFIVALGAALLAGLYPAYRLGRLITARALRSE
ncbi:MAG: FtsX-like permease family protein [Chloroflexota bacterium]